MRYNFSEPNIGAEEIEAVTAVLKSGWMSMGPKVIEFENLFKAYVGVSEAVAVNSCTAALFLSLKALGIGKGDEVITTPFTFVSTVNVIEHCGATPVFVDICEDNLNLDIQKVEAAITPRTKAILPVHYAGQPCDMDELLQLAKKYSLRVVEDAAHALGATYKNKKIGSLGDSTCFSFYANKNITTGEGGMVTTNNAALAQELRILRLHGMSSDGWKRYAPGSPWRYDVSRIGYKYNMTDMQAALGICQLRKLDGFNAIREKLTGIYNSQLQNVTGVRRLGMREHRTSANFAYTILVENRDKVISALNDKNIGTSVFFTPIYTFSAYSSRYDKSKFPVCNAVASKSLVLPLHTKINEADIKYICDSLIEIVK